VRDTYELYRAGQQSLRDGNPRYAVTVLEQAAEAEPRDRSIRFELARAYFAFAALQRAEDTARALVEEDPVDADAAHLLGRTLLRRGRTEEAQRWLRLAAVLDPSPEHTRWAG
jgi:Flp pilus assembly protein TadD